MKIFVRAAQMNEKNPQVVGVYPRETEIEPDAHGEDTIMLEVPDKVLIPARMPMIDPTTALKEMPEIEPFPRLPNGWREGLAAPILQAEAERRASAVLSPHEQVATLHEVLDLTLQHGVDVSKWPAQAKSRKADIDDAWKYVRDVRARANTLKSLPSNPTSDKNWPAKPAKKKS